MRRPLDLVVSARRMDRYDQGEPPRSKVIPRMSRFNRLPVLQGFDRSDVLAG
jgi:hypothetical protein